MPRYGSTFSHSLSRRGALCLLTGGAGHLSAAPAVPLRLALSETLVMDVNMNDARAALLVWIKRICSEMDLPVEYKPEVFDTSSEILKRIRSLQVDAVALNVIEYRQVSDVLDSSEVLIQDDGAKRQCVLLVKAEGGVQKLADLRGHKLILQRSPSMCVAPDWLDLLLATEHLEPRERFFSSVATEVKAAKVLLPVFFGQADACLTSKRAFESMAELNPQVSKRLRAIATSPELVSTCYMFRKGYRDISRERWVKALSDMRASVTGRQLLTLFQADGLVTRGPDCLVAAMSILEQAERARRLQRSSI